MLGTMVEVPPEALEAKIELPPEAATEVPLPENSELSEAPTSNNSELTQSAEYFQHELSRKTQINTIPQNGVLLLKIEPDLSSRLSKEKIDMIVWSEHLEVTDTTELAEVQTPQTKKKTIAAEFALNGTGEIKV